MNIVMLLKPKCDVAFLYEDYTLRQGLEKMRYHGYTAIPVNARDGTYVGTVSEGDFLWSVLDNGGQSLKDEEMFLSAANTGIIDCSVEVTELMGAETYLYLSCAGVNLTARVSPRSTARAGDTIKMAIDVNNIHVFDKETEKVILN